LDFKASDMMTLASANGADSIPGLVRAALIPLADPDRAAPMRTYMRDRFEFLGIPTPQRRAATRAAIRAGKACTADELLSYAKHLWREPQREFQYVAIDLLAANWRALLADEGAVANVQHLLALARQRSWWDSVDGLAGVVGDVVRAGSRAGAPARKRLAAAMDAALVHPDPWVRRIAMLHQLGWGADTDAARLFRYADALAPETDFFLRKAAGWALRDYARHDPQAVRRFLDSRGERLSALTRREAGKHL
jgi:3-methyladenine DNA glycosylase AlkD